MWLELYCTGGKIMKDVIKWFEDEKEFGCIEYKGKNVYILFYLQWKRKSGWIF